MKLSNILIPTGVAEPGMTVREVFRMCVEAGVPAIPYCTQPCAHPDGLISIDRILKNTCLPDYLIGLAEVLGNSLSCIDNAEEKVHEILGLPIDPFVLMPIRSITSEAPVLKAVAILQKYETNYMFVIDEDGYRGVVTNVAIVKRMLEFDLEHQHQA